MDEKRRVLRHFLAALAYRTQKALRDAPPDFGTFRAAAGVRTPAELVCHMTSVLGYARTFFIGGHYRPDALPSLQAETERLHDMLVDLSRHLESGTPLLQGMSPERLLQGPFSDAMTHAGQIAILRRLAGGPIAPENFIVADIDGDRCGSQQALPVSPDESWPEAPAGWTPPSRKGGVGVVEKVNLSEKLARFEELWSPKAVGAVNDFHVKLVKLKGEFVWHSHEVEDELFLVLHGRLRMQFRDREVVVEPGELVIVPHQTEHRPVAEDEVHVLLLEPASTLNTGTAGGERTREVEWI